MKLKPIRNDRELNRALKRIDELWGAKPNTQRGDELDIGTSGRVSEVLSKKRSLTLGMIKKLREGLKIPYDCLIA